MFRGGGGNSAGRAASARNRVTNLPAPYAFDMPLDEVEAKLEAILKDGYTVLSPRRRDALGSYIFQAEAQKHFIRRVERVPKKKIDKIAFSVAQCLARAARLTPDQHLDVRQSLSAMAIDAKMVPNTFIGKLDALVNLGLIEILARGTRNGHPFHIRLCINAEHHEQITLQAAKSLRDHLELQTRRLMYG